MLSTKIERKGQPPIVRKVSVVDTLLLIKHGETVRYIPRELGTQGSVASAVSRLNARGNAGTFSLKLINNGEMFEITRV